MTDSGPLVIALVVLLAVAMLPTTLGLPASQPTPGQVGDPVPVAETTNRLALSGDQRGGHHVVRPDLGSALLGSDDVLRTDHEQYVLMEHDFNSVPVGQRDDLVRQTYQRILDRIDILEAHEAEAVRAHANGTISDTQLVQSRHRISIEAEYLESAIDEVAQRSSRSPGIAISASQFRDDKSRLEMLQTPVSDRIDASLRGVALDGTTPLTIRTTQTGYHLATVDDGTYIFETTRFDNRDESAPDQFNSITDAFDYATSLYPWASQYSSSPAVNERTTANLYWIQFPHDQGSLEAYLDAGTGEIHREIQELSLASLPRSTAGGPWTDDDLVLSINETPLNGPIQVTVREIQDAEPVDATIEVDGTPIAETGEDGTVWIVPAGRSYEVTAIDGDRTVSTVSTE